MSTRNWNVGELIAGYTDADLDNLTKEDFRSMVEMLKYATSNMAEMEQKMVALRDEVKALKFDNHEFVKMNLDFKRVLKQNDEDSRKLLAIVRKYQHPSLPGNNLGRLLLGTNQERFILLRQVLRRRKMKTMLIIIFTILEKS